MTENMSDPLDVAGNVYKLKMENDRVRVFDVTFRPGDKAVMHHHPDHVVYVLSGGKMALKLSNGKTDTLDLVEGNALFLEAQAHEAQNIGESTIKLLVVELKKHPEQPVTFV
jgi:quercetin dioxygenase-like cupin family protein